MLLKTIRALVTRPREEAEILGSTLAERGIETIIEPLIEVHCRVPAELELAGVQAILCTSGNGVRALARATEERRLPLLAVGDRTAARARTEGFTAVESAGGDFRDLVRLAAARLHPRGGKLLHVAGDVIAGDLAGALRPQGFAVERSVLYETRPAAALSSTAIHALRFGAIDIALFFSPRTAAVFARLAGLADITGHCGTVTALSISRAANAALADLPWYDRRVAERPNQRALLGMLDRIIGERQR
jgi:uroporphyrinogen-III synthase